MAVPARHYGRWRIRWIDSTGRRRSEVYDSHADAEFALRRHEVEAHEVRRGLRAAPPPPKSVGDLCDYWLEKRAPLKRSRHDDESIIRCHLRRAFGGLRVIDLGVSHVDTYVAERAHLHAKTIANHLTLLVSMLNVAVDLGWLAKVPRIRKPRVRLFGRDYRYLRTQSEVDRFLAAARDDGESVFVLYAAAVYTGMRAGELAGLRWSDVDLDRRVITVQRSFDGPTKADDVRYVPILDPVLPVLRAWRLRCPGEMAFPNRDGGMHGESARTFQEVLRRVLRAAGFPETPREGKRPRPYVTFHDLRHTFASHWVMGGGDVFRLQKILGHKSIQMTMRYAHLAPDAFTQDYGRLGTRAPGTRAEVVALEDARSRSAPDADVLQQGASVAAVSRPQAPR